jgi:hypothetical protein
MNSPHGRPSPALLRSIHRPHPRHNAEKCRRQLDQQAPAKPPALAFPQLNSNKNAKSLIAVRRAWLFWPGNSIYTRISSTPLEE